MAIVLGPNQYGKAEVRVVAVDRSTPRHTLVDLDVSSSLRGDFSAAHTAGDNAHVLATDTQKNTVFAFARDGVGTPEAFGLRLARHFAGSYDWITGARVAVESYGWDRISVSGQPHEHAFRRAGAEVRTAVVTVDRSDPAHPDAHVLAGLHDLVVLKTTGSEFWGFPRDRYTTLAETRDRILATAVTARWRYTATDLDFDELFASVRTTLLETFATTHSLALQQSLYAMGEAVLETHADVAEIRMSMPNKHHFLQDLSAHGLDNPDVVYHADDRPYGLIEGVVLRDDVPPAEIAWQGTPGFC
jgi:urate oxidase